MRISLLLKAMSEPDKEVLFNNDERIGNLSIPITYNELIGILKYFGSPIDGDSLLEYDISENESKDY